MFYNNIITIIKYDFIQNGAPELYDPNGGQHTGPNLYGVFGRKVASESNYTNYSTQALYKDTVWDEENLDKFLTNPKRFIPGTKMVFIGLKNGKDRKGAKMIYKFCCTVTLFILPL